MDTTKLVVGQKVEMTHDIYSNKGIVVEVTSSGVVVATVVKRIRKTAFMEYLETEFVDKKQLVSFDKDGEETEDSRYTRLGLRPNESGPGPEFGPWCIDC